MTDGHMLADGHADGHMLAAGQADAKKGEPGFPGPPRGSRLPRLVGVGDGLDLIGRQGPGRPASLGRAREVPAQVRADERLGDLLSLIGARELRREFGRRHGLDICHGNPSFRCVGREAREARSAVINYIRSIAHATPRVNSAT